MVFLSLLGNILHVGGLGLHSLDQVGAILFLQLLDFFPLEYGAVRIGITAEAARTLNDGTEALTVLDTVGAGMNHFSGNGNHRPNILPTGKLPDRENVAIAEADVGIWFISHRFRDRYGHVVTDNFAALRYFVTR